jgi:hypothetical protein
MLTGELLDMQNYTCPAWFLNENDNSRPCEVLFDCYLPALAPTLPSGVFPSDVETGTCHSVHWFQDKWGWDLLRMVTLSWMLSHDDPPYSQTHWRRFTVPTTKWKSRVSRCMFSEVMHAPMKVAPALTTHCTGEERWI